MDVKTIISDKDKIKLKEALDYLYNYIVEVEDEKDAALKKVREWNKDEEIQKLTLAYNKLRNKLVNEFTITEEENSVIHQWLARHARKKHNGNLNINESYIFTPTGLGTVKTVKCNHCGEEFMFNTL